MLISTWLTAVRNRFQSPKVVKRRLNQKRSAETSENLETRALLTSPTLVAIRPNVGDILLEGETRYIAPRELTLQFNPGQIIDASTLANGISVQRGGVDRTLNGVGDVPVTIGFVGIGDRPEEVVVRFAENLPDDVYRITIKGSGPNRVENIANEAFNDGVDLSRNFRLDLGAVVEGVVPQPVLRDKLITITSAANLRDGDRVTVTVGGVRRVFEFNSSGNIRASSDVAVNFTASQSAATIAANLQAAIAGEPLGATVTRTGSTVKLVGNAFTPTISKSLTNATAVTVSDGGLQQRRNMVVVHFNEDDLNPASAQNPTFYRLVNTSGTLSTADDSLLIPESVVYDSVSNTAVLTFANNLPNATFALRIGSDFEQETLAGAVNIGTILQNSFSTTGFIGGPQGAKDVDLYRFNLTGIRAVNLSVTPAVGTDVVLRIFNNAGTQVFIADAAGSGGTETLSVSLNGGSYYVGVSSKGNSAYTPGNLTTSTTGTTTGSYSLSIGSSQLFSPNDGNSGFATATNLGILGASSQVVNSQIEPQNIPLPPYAGGNDEPGHRDIPAESHIGSAGTTPAVPGAMPVIQFNFADVYGRDPQNNILHNAITENQKQRAREIFEIWSEKTGMMVEETANSGIQIITGDLRAFEPLMPPNAAAGLGSAGSFAIMNANIDWGSSEYGGAWFGVALHEIGHALGLDHAYDLISVMGEGEDGPANPREPIFPTDHDTVHIQRLYQPNGTDIDMYQFNLTTSGRLSAEVFAERQGSHLDSVLRLYDSSRNLLSQNDNYFSADSFVGVDLPAGTYFIGVSSTGNDAYNPDIADSGYGGTTEGSYQLRLKFDPVATNKMLDAPLGGSGPGVEFDGDADGNAGGEYEFFFKVANTVFVDKTAANGGNGTIAAPFNRIDLALNAAASGSIVRIVGNGGADGNEITANDAVPYLVGLTPEGAILQDGGSIEVPQGVTLMIDADAVIKLQAANIDAGSSAQGIDRSNGAIQILGVPSRPVYLTSYLNDSLGGDSNGVGPAVGGGNWGGIVFRDDSDYEAQGIFLNYVNKAHLSFGGGEVIVDSVPEIFTPIHMESARPTITFNTITNSTKAAISANPNSFDESGDRIGPEIHGNRLVNNTINGLFVRIKTQLGSPIDTVDVQARFDDDDIVHVITENLAITGSPGGPLDGVPRLSGRLEVDPGVIVKMGGARIEALLGNSNFIAEGTKERPVVITSTLDDEFGIGGTFDTTNNLSTSVAAPGDWGGIFFNATSTGSIDQAILRFGGGRTPIEGEFNEFNLIEIHQADVRVGNSRLEFNALGTGVSGVDASRNGRGTNGDAVIFVRGAQPIIVNNEFRENAGSHIISIDVNSLNSFERLDRGRSTGMVARLSSTDGNTGPLISGNLMRNNGIEGMEVRGGALTTQVIWDDTDIVHVLYDEIYVPNHHTYSGIRLQSKPTESLVVKLDGTNAGITAGGNELDIDDRIGGTVQIIGAPGFPVVMTSLQDDTVGAGFDLDGFPVLDTNGDGNATVQSAGDWRSIKFEQYSNDRNVRVVMESENALTGGQETPIPQLIGTLAPNEKSGDDNRPVGFEIHGHISPDTTTDIDTYSFKATTGTEVWFDLDRTSGSFDSVLELVSATGSVLARSDAGVLTGLALPMDKSAALGGDYYSTNYMDEGFRVVLPGAAGAEGTYFVRVRSKNGASAGAYQLQIRVNQRDEIPGSTVRFADIRYATDGIEMYGLPGHSPLTGEAGESAGGDNNGIGGAEFIGDLLSSDRNTISVSGSLSSANDVDFFSFSVDYQFIQAIAGVNSGGKSWATIFDIDYADGLSRPDTILSVYNSTGQLIFVSRDSDIIDDQPAPGTGTGLDDLTRGSVGKLDAFLGTVALPEANDMRYYVAVSSNGRMPAALQQTFEANAADPLARLEPINSIQRIVEDHIGFQGYSSVITQAAANPTPKPILPATPEGLFDITTATKLDTYVKPFTFSDVSLFSATNNGGALLTANPFTGAITTGIATGLAALEDIAVRPDGVLFGFLNNSGGAFRQIDLANGNFTGGGSTGIPTFGVQQQDIAAMAFRRTPEVTTGSYELFAVNNFNWDQNGANNDNEAGPVIWRMNASTGAVIDENTGVAGLQPLGALPPGVSIQGLAFASQASSVLFAVDSNGTLWRTTVGGNQGSRSIGGWTQVAANIPGFGVGFSNLTLGPQNVEDARYSQMLFATGTDGNLYAFNQTGVLQTIFDADGDGVAESSSTPFGITNQTGFPITSPGLAFSPLDFNLWHPTLRRRGDAGHGINTAPDNSRTPNAPEMQRVINSRSTLEGEGGASFYFGLEQWEQNPGSANAYFQYGANQGQFGVLNGALQRELTNNATIANTYNLLGGAYGSLITNSFSLEGYKATDRPTVYFNYFLATDNTNFADDRMRDAARVYASGDGGVTWQLIATNNSTRNRTDSELPAYASHSATQTPLDVRQGIQELFDNTGGWRQARIDLGGFGGSADVKLRFDFSTSGDVNDSSVDGLGYGTMANRDRSLDNSREGFYVDDIIVGIANRGEMATTSGGNLGGAFYNAPIDPSLITQHLVGEYQLEIRRGTEFGSTDDPLTPTFTVGTPFKGTDRFVSEYTLTVPTSDVIQAGDSYTISDGIISRTFVFNPVGALPSGSIAVAILPNATKGEVASALASAINGVSGFKVVATTRPSSVNSDIVDLTGAMNVTANPVTAPSDLIVDIAATTVAEEGANTTFTVTRTGSLTNPLTVQLALTDVATGLASVNGVITDGTNTGTTITVLIPAGSATVVLPLQLDPTPNAIYDGSRAVRITATATGMNSISDIIDITDNEAAPLGVIPFGTLGLTLLQTSVSETAGTAGIRGYVTLPSSPTDLDPYDGIAPLTVSLTSSDGSEVRSTTTQFLDGEWRAFFSMEVLDEFFDSGTSTVTIFATAPGFASTSATIDVTAADNVEYVNRLGDKNLHRQQGMVIIESNSIRDFSGFGIISDAAPRTPGNQTNPGSVRNLATLNGLRLVPGVTIRNNVIANLGTGGILFSGEGNTGNVPFGPVPFGKIINNTIYGGAVASGVGIRVEQNASPTLLNNVVANTSVGIQIDASSSSTVVATTLFHGNTTPGTVGSDFILANPADPLFVDPAQNNYYPASGSAAVDSSLNILGDRPAFIAVKNPLGIPTSDLVAPDFDMFGQKRQDDLGQPNAGLGTDIFKDRGAVERADFLGPFARFTAPAEDNNTGDLDANLTRIHVDNLVFPTTLSLDLLDGGIGVDDARVSSSQFQLRQNGVLLVENVDYRWRYNPNNNRVYFVSVTTFPVDTRYSISIDNSATTGIRDLAGNRLSANQLDGSTVFTLLLTDGVNNAPVNNVPMVGGLPATLVTAEDTPLVFSAANNSLISVSDQDAYLGRIGSSVNFTQDDGILDVVLDPTSGRLTLSGVTGLTFSIGDGISDPLMRFQGTIADINQAMDGMTFVPDQDYNGLAAPLLRIATRDLGNFGPLPLNPQLTITEVNIAVTPVNDLPSFDLAATNLTRNEDGGLVTIPGFMTNMSAGPANESTQVLSTQVAFTSENSRWTLNNFFTSTGTPQIDASSGNLKFRTAPDVNGTATISVSLLDDAGGVTTKTFTITVSPVNDAPVFTLNPGVNPIRSDEDTSLSDPISVDLINTFAPARATALDELTGATAQTTQWILGTPVRTDGNLVLDILQIRPDGTLEYRPRKDTAGTATVSLRLRDNGLPGAPNVNQSAIVTLTIIVNQINDAPVARSGNYTIDEGFAVRLNASASTDVDLPFGDILHYAWDLDNNGSFETSTGTNPIGTISWATLAGLGYSGASTRSIRLRVTDTAGETSIITRSLRTLVVDYGDAPNSFGTFKGTGGATGGAAHTISGGLRLGSLLDSEWNGQPNAAATGDGSDEDGVAFPTFIETTGARDLPSFVDVTASAAGKLDIWLDLNGNGRFDHATEHLNGGTSFDVVKGVNRIEFTIPRGTTVGDRMMRFRISTAGSLQPIGRAANGEVEDYRVRIRALQNPVKPSITLPIDFDTTDGLIPQTTDFSPEISWTRHPQNFNYNVVVRNSANVVVFSRTGTTETSFVIPATGNLAAGTYQVTVTAFNKAGTAAAPATLQFRVVGLAISSPSGPVATSRPPIRWNHVPGSRSYTVHVVSTTTNATVVWKRFNTAGLSNPSEYVPPGNLALGLYKVRVQATDAGGKAGDWSPFVSFQVKTAPVMTAPATTVTAARPLIGWTAVPGAARYEIVVFNVTDNRLFARATNVTGTSWAPTKNLTLAQYRVRVRAFNAAGNVGEWSEYRVFNYAPVPTVINPKGRLADSTPTFGWNAVPSADSYQLIVRQDFGNFAVVYQNNALTTTIHTIPQPLPLGRYTYEIVAINNAVNGMLPGAFSSRSLVTTFTVSQAPVVTDPDATTFLARPTIRWTNPPGTSSDASTQVRLRIVEGSTTRTIFTRMAHGETSFVPPADLVIGTYIVDVRTRSTVDPQTVSDWSTPKTFRVTVAPTTIGPNGRIADATPTLNWSGALGSITYRVIIDNLTVGVTAVDVSGIAALNYTVPTDLPIGRYQYRVQARSAFGAVSQLSTARTFQIVTAPEVTGPGASTFDTTPSFSWTNLASTLEGNATGALSYDFRLVSVVGGNEIFEFERSLQSTAYTIPTALPTGTYRVYVRGVNPDIQGNFSSPVQFVIGGQPVVNFIGSTSDSTPTISWSSVDGASSYEIFIATKADPGRAVVRQDGIGATSFTVPTALAKGEYRVWIRAVNAATGNPGAWSTGSSTFLRITDAGAVQNDGLYASYTLTASADALEDIGSEAAVSMLPATVYGSVSRLPVIPQQDEQPQVLSVAVAGENSAVQEAVVTTVGPDVAPAETDEVLSRWDEQTWWDSAASQTVSQVVETDSVDTNARPTPTLYASAGLLGAILSLAPRSLRRRKDESAS